MIAQRRKLVDLRGGKGFHSCGRQIDLWFDSMLQRCIRVMQDLRVADTVREWSEWSHQQKCHSRGITSAAQSMGPTTLREDSHGSSGSNRGSIIEPRHIRPRKTASSNPRQLVGMQMNVSTGWLCHGIRGTDCSVGSRKDLAQ
eukprot:GHVU01126765.1.p2 GENE.GHVU01126765.1~~GHVU01126765.1.p2  ORF type:complete len:143 (-),score=4.78 GHVU01126765.1:630-1058(-)